MDRNNLHAIILLLLTLLFVRSLFASPAVYEVLSISEIAVIDSMLKTQDLELRHLQFHRDWDLSTRLKSKWHMEILQKGIASLDNVSALRQSLALSEGNLFQLINQLGAIAWDKSIAEEKYQAVEDKMRTRFVREVSRPKDIFVFVESFFAEIETCLNKAFAELNPAQLDTLAAFFVQASIEDEDKQSYQEIFTHKGLPWIGDVELTRIADLVEKVRFENLLCATLQQYTLAKVLSEGVLNLRFTNKTPITYKSKYGLMIIGSKNDDLYNPKSIKKLAKQKPCLIIDPAGNDVYEIHLSTNRSNPLYILIDLKGDDLYRNSEPLGIFCSILGLGVSIDQEGNDAYHGGDFSFASVLGSGIHVDKEGRDFYDGGLFSQAASAVGIYLLVDFEGNDSYNATCMAQGFGSSLGAGSLIDFDGADTYYIGGKYNHAPLMPNDYRSMGQGMGFGMRPDLAGGLGLLYDARGNDKYIGGVYAQGVGYWYSTGVLIDESGNDVYNAIYYPQGSGIHMASGILYDGSGDDTYYSRNGPGQGAGHDWSFGMLVDASGNDAYSIHGGGGLGLSNSVGIFVDKKGNDRYERKEVQNYGSANFSRSTGGIGIFLDAAGRDVYPDSLMQDNKSWNKGSYGFGRDVELNVDAQTTIAQDIADDPIPEKDEPIEKIFAAASEWEVGSAIKRVRAARVILQERENEALEYILANKLNNKSGLEYRALEAFCDFSETFRERLFEFVVDSDSLKAKTAISLLAGEKDLRLLPYLEDYLQNKKYIPTCISTLGYLNHENSVAILAKQEFTENERLRFLVVRALSQIDTPEAKMEIMKYITDESFLIQALIRSLPKDKQ